MEQATIRLTELQHEYEIISKRVDELYKANIVATTAAYPYCGTDINEFNRLRNESARISNEFHQAGNQQRLIRNEIAMLKLEIARLRSK